MSVIYCDRCKVNALQCSKLFYETGREEWHEDDECPNCGYELSEADTFEDIP